MRVLVTGSSGFIGRHLVRALARRGDEVRGLDRTPAPAGPAAVTCDLLDRGAVLELFREFQPEAVVHLAARTDLEGRSLQDYAANTVGVANVVRAVRATPSVRRVIYTSSQLVCGVGYVPRHDTDYQPTTLYGESKVETEGIVRAEDGGGADWCLVRPTTVWGPGMSPHYERFLRMIQRGTYVHLGRTEVRRSLGYVGNVVHEFERLLAAAPETVGRKMFYLADYQPVSLRDWAEGFRRALEAPPIRSVPLPVARAIARCGDVLNRLGWASFPFNSFRLRNVLTEAVCDLSPTEAVCGPLPFTVEVGIDRTVEWLRSHPAPQVMRSGPGSTGSAACV